jgi:hypothetical protein
MSSRIRTPADSLWEGSAWSREVKSELEWRLQKIRDARNVEHLLRKVTGNKWSNAKREAMDLQLARSWRQAAQELGAHISTLCTLDARHGDIRFNLCPAGFDLALVLSVLSMPPFLHFGMRMVTLCNWILEVCNFLFDFYRCSQLRVCLESQRRLWTWTFKVLELF